LPSILFQDQRHFRAGRDPVTSQLRVLGPNLVLFESGVAGVVDREKFRVDGVALRMPNAFRLFETNLH
jgi:hypothetical protein